MKAVSFLFVILLVVLVACKEEPVVYVEPDYEFIQFEVAGKAYEFKEDIGLSIYYKSDTQDQLGLVMGDSESFDFCEIYLLETRILNKRLPVKFNNRTSYFDGFATMNFTEWKSGKEMQYVNYSGNGLEVTVTSYQDSLLRGEFSGPLQALTGEEIVLSKGRFKVKFAYD